MQRTRRNVLKAGGVALTVAIAGCSSGDGGNGNGNGGNGGNGGSGNGNGSNGGGGGVPSEVSDYLSDANGFDSSLADKTGSSEVTVEVGTGDNGYGFTPPAIQVDSGTKVVWEWTGKGNTHNVVHEDGDFESELSAEEGFTFEHTFESSGTFLYYCQPHKSLGMKGAVVVE